MSLALFLAIVEEAKWSSLVGSEVDYTDGFYETDEGTVPEPFPWVHVALFAVRPFPMTRLTKGFIWNDFNGRIIWRNKIWQSPSSNRSKFTPLRKLLTR
jgi:hypothetical protein